MSKVSYKLRKKKSSHGSHRAKRKPNSPLIKKGIA